MPSYALLVYIVLIIVIVSTLVYSQRQTIVATKVYKWLSEHFAKLAIRVLRQGPIPRHVGIIMDGNRRYARKKHYEKTGEGHVAGFYKLATVLEWCNELRIQKVSVYAFAINNFNRPKSEVDMLMGLAREKLVELAEKSDLVRKHRVRIKVVGNLSLLADDVRESAEKAMRLTSENNGMLLNLCFPYSSTDEITTAIRRAVEECDDIKESDIEKRLMISGDDLDILIRTSGEIRFSNFMLWQASKFSFIKFVDAYWPEFSIWNMLTILVSWQLSAPSIHKRKGTKLSYNSAH